jgi:flagellar biosynthesis protein FlhF
MRIKSFTAGTMAEAMMKVKEEMGDDAIIVSTREDSATSTFRVTAALDDGGDDGYEDEAVSTGDPALQEPLEAGEYEDDDGEYEDDDEETTNLDQMLLTPEALSQPASAQKSPVKAPAAREQKPATPARKKPRPAADKEDLPRRPPLDWARIQGEPDFIHQLADSAYSVLIDHGTPRRLARVIADKVDEDLARVRARNEPSPDIIEALTAGIRRHFSFQTPAELWTDRALMMVGPHGSGKTLALAKMAARAVLRGLKPVVITTDVVRAGAIEQLSAFTRIMDIDLLTADEPSALREVLDQLPKERQQVLIDTAAVNPFDQEAVSLLDDMVTAAKAEPLIVLAAGTDAVEAGTIATALRAVGARHLIATRLDATSRFGSLLAAADLGRLHFSYLGRSTSVTAGLQEAQPELLAQLLTTKGGVL